MSTLRTLKRTMLRNIHFNKHEVREATKISKVVVYINPKYRKRKGNKNPWN